jgi:hypothetical protein
MDKQLASDESDVLKTILSALIVNNRTGEVGFIHGFNRFVGTKVILKKAQIGTLNSARLKFGLSEMKEYRDK